MTKHREWAGKGTEVSIERDGKTYTGFYQVEDELIRVTYEAESKTTQLGNLPPRLAVFSRSF
jgi:hypothetical protein